MSECPHCGDASSDVQHFAECAGEKRKRREFIARVANPPSALMQVFDATSPEDCASCITLRETDIIGRNSLHYAAMGGILSVFKLLLDAYKKDSCSLEVKSSLGWTVAHSAAYGGNSSVLHLSILCCQCASDLTNKGQTLAHCAALGRSSRTLKYCIENHFGTLDTCDKFRVTVRQTVLRARHPLSLQYVKSLDSSTSSGHNCEETAPDPPRLCIDEKRLIGLLSCQQAEAVHVDGFIGVIKLPVFSPCDDCGNLVRSAQEKPILSTAVGGRKSFLEMWRTNPEFRDELLRHADPGNQGKWDLSDRYDYKIPTTFIPCLAGGVYQLLAAKLKKSKIRVLDPCAGWGDRLCGAVASGVVEEYVGVDPNGELFIGYSKLIAGLKNHYECTTRITMILQAFEDANHFLPKDYFDVVFTSPPFFDYELYNEGNPTYRDWEKEFFTPLVDGSLGALSPGGYLAIHMDDSSAGKVPSCITENVVGRIGIQGTYSSRIFNVWVKQRSLDCDEHSQKRQRTEAQ